MTAAPAPDGRADAGLAAERFPELLRAAQRGDGAALSALWSGLSGQVASFVRGRGGRDVDEITNDVFLAAFTGLSEFQGDLPGFRALLFTIARRRVIDESRRRTRRLDARAWSPVEDERAAGSTEDLVLVRESDRLLVQRLDVLTPDQRDVVLLRLIADLSIDEVARVLGKSTGTVKSLQRRGLDRLRRTWDHPGPPLRGPDRHADDRGRAS